MADINWKKLRENATSVLTGDYPVQVEKASHKVSQAGNPMISMTLVVTGGPFAGRKVFHNLVLADAQFAQKKFFNHLEALGADERFFDTEPTMDAVVAQIMGRQAVATFKEGEFRGEPKEEVEAMKAASGPFVSTAGSANPFGEAASLKPAAPTVAADASAPPADPF
jgi:hypothetical protein